MWVRVFILSICLIPNHCWAQVLSYEQWKGGQIKLTEITLKQLGGEPEAAEWARIGLEEAESLSLKDYYAIYLANLKKEELVEAVKQLKPNQIAELLIDNANSDEYLSNNGLIRCNKITTRIAPLKLSSQAL